MGSEWMGRYRPLVAALVLHSNIVNRAANERMEIGCGIRLTPQEWQTLEFIVEHDDSFFSMIEIARQLGIPQSSFSRTVKVLHDQTLIAKYQVAGNRKNIILRPTEKGLQIYNNRMEDPIREDFRQFFKELEPLSDEDLQLITKALNHLTLSLPSAKDSLEVKLIEIE